MLFAFVIYIFIHNMEFNTLITFSTFLLFFLFSTFSFLFMNGFDVDSISSEYYSLSHGHIAHVNIQIIQFYITQYTYIDNIPSFR